MSYHAEGTAWRNKPHDSKTNLDERQIKLVEMLVDGSKTKGEIAEILGVHRNTITNWCKDERIKALVAEYEADKIKQANSYYIAKAPIAAQRLWEMAEQGRNTKEKDLARKIYSYFSNRALGTPSGKMIVEDTREDTEDFNLDELVKRLESNPIPKAMNIKIAE